jgi:hypothetical protein
MCALLSELSINCRLGASYGHAGEAGFHSPLYVLSADLELETVQARDVGRLDYEGYTFVHHASWAGPWAFCALHSEPSVNSQPGALYGHAGETRLHSPLYVLSSDPELEAV